MLDNTNTNKVKQNCICFSIAKQNKVKKRKTVLHFAFLGFILPCKEKQNKTMLVFANQGKYKTGIVKTGKTI